MIVRDLVDIDFVKVISSEDTLDNEIKDLYAYENYENSITFVRRIKRMKRYGDETTYCFLLGSVEEWGSLSCNIPDY